MAIGPISSLGSVGSLGPIGPGRPISGADSAAGAGISGTDSVGEAGKSFGSVLAGGIDKLQATHTNADKLAVQAATGDLRDVHDYMLAASRAGHATQLTVAVRNKALEAYSEIMRMPV